MTLTISVTCVEEKRGRLAITVKSENSNSEIKTMPYIQAICISSLPLQSWEAITVTRPIRVKSVPSHVPIMP